jgi:hypothetical protein
MKRITTLTDKNIPRLSVARGGEPVRLRSFFDSLTPEQRKAALQYQGEENLGDPCFARNWTTEQARADFTRVCDDMGLKLRKDTPAK